MTTMIPTLYFRAESAVSNRSRCRHCRELIERKSLRLGSKIPRREIDVDFQFWYHPSCFFAGGIPPSGFCVGDIGHFEELRYSDQQDIRKAIHNYSSSISDVFFGEENTTNSPSDSRTNETRGTKRKYECISEIQNRDAENELERIIAEQNKKMYGYRDKLEGLTMEELIQLFQYNRQVVPRKIKHKMLNRLSDGMQFGALKSCVYCETGQLVYRSGVGYFCLGKSQWSSCNSVFDDPPRGAFIVPDNLKEKYLFLREYEFQPAKRIRNLNNTPSPWTLEQNKRMCLSASSLYRPRELTAILEQRNAGVPVDRHCEGGSYMHVYRDRINNDIYNAVLVQNDASNNKNSYYKLQVLKFNEFDGYRLFKAWGRIGEIGDRRCKSMAREVAIEKFKKAFHKRTGNRWEDRAHFNKCPGKKNFITETYSNVIDRVVEASGLEEPIKNLIRLIFDTILMERVMKEKKLDLKVLPLGNLSRQQVQTGLAVLSKAYEYVVTKGEGIYDRKMDSITHEFYNRIPSDYGIYNPPQLNDLNLIKHKAEILNSLLTIEEIVHLMEQCHITENGYSLYIMDSLYAEMRVDLRPLYPSEERYKVIESYLQNTHSKLHDSYKLEIVEIFSVSRHGETERFVEFKGLHRKLLWHGTELINVPSILSQGLRIPEGPPANGKFFGKGLYFANMSSKSANYSRPEITADHEIGFLFLCEVAVGSMLEAKFEDPNIQEKLDLKICQSVKGLGSVVPDQTETVMLNDDVEVPLGCGIPAELNGEETFLKHNEYVVYNESQVSIRYLVQVKYINPVCTTISEATSINFI